MEINYLNVKEDREIIVFLRMTLVDWLFKKTLHLFPSTDEGLPNPPFQLCKH
jgi:hypothetical protein